MVEETTLVEVLPASALEAQTRGEIDIQVVTAKRYPRSVTGFIREMTELATLDEDTAASCIYALPRDGKNIEGPSARFAEIAASCWGHMRIEGRVVDEDDRFVTTRGTSWDLQRNVAIGYEVKRRITDRSGRKYKDDMIGVTANAGTSIALRNAILKNIPKAYWGPIYQKCREAAVGKAGTLADKRAAMLAYFQKMGVQEAQVCALLEVPGVADIGLDHLATLKGVATAIKEGDTTVDEVFVAVKPGVQQPQRKTETPAPTPQATVPPAQTAPAPAAKPVPPSTKVPELIPLTLADVRKKKTAKGADQWTIRDSDGRVYYVFDTAVGTLAEEAFLNQTPLAEIASHQSKDGKYLYLDTLVPAPAPAEQPF